MKFKLNKYMFDLLKENVPDALEYVIEVQGEDQINFVIKDSDVSEVKLLINDEIVLHGMDNQDTVNDLGLRLYKLYDDILYQKNNQ